MYVLFYQKIQFLVDFENAFKEKALGKEVSDIGTFYFRIFFSKNLKFLYIEENFCSWMCILG